jgi:uncharacterized repeat protein (TIGR03803 family)
MRHWETLFWILFASLCCQAQTYTTLYAFQGGVDGNAPLGSLTLDAEGNLYGTTVYGGRKNAGTVFKLSQGVKTTLHSFTSDDGASPNGGLILDAAGNLYGTSSDVGMVFRISPQGAITTLFRFNGVNGENPTAGVVSDAAGNLYGTTSKGGPNGLGTVFQLTLQKNGTYAHKIIWQPTGRESQPYGPLVFDGAGNLYGTTAYGSGYGSIYELTRRANGTWAHTVLHGFDFAGRDPITGVIVDSSGNLYGTTEQGANDYGNAFEFSQGQFSVLQTFTYSDGAGASRLVMDAAGNLYGETETGGAYGWGTVFKLNPYTVLHDFDLTNLTPNGGLIVDGAGNLYGVTFGLGQQGSFGTVFEIQP